MRRVASSPGPHAEQPDGRRQDVGGDVAARILDTFGVEILNDGMGGKRIVARRGFEIGEAVLRSEALAWLLDEGAARSRCDGCLGRLAESGALECRRCSAVRHCSKPCQIRARDLHRLECAGMEMLRRRVDPAFEFRARAVLRLLVRAACGSPGEREPRLECVASHRDVGLASALGPQGEGNAHESELARTVLECLPPHVLTSTTEDAVLDAFGRAMVNGFTIYDHDEAVPPRLGHGLYPLASFANHSCNPSCAWTFRGPSLVFRALRPLAPGDEVTIAYRDVLYPLGERRSSQRCRLFACACPRCRGVDPEAAAGDVLLEARTCPTLCGGLGADGPPALLGCGLVRCAACGAEAAGPAAAVAALHPCHWLALHLARARRAAAAARGDWEAAAPEAARAAAAVCRLAGHLTDARAQSAGDLAMLGTVEQARGRLAAAAAAFDAAAEAAAARQGSGSALARRMRTAARRCAAAAASQAPAAVDA